MSIVEGPRSFHLLGTASVVVDDRELAWAEVHVRPAPDIKWILGNYVQSSTSGDPQPNLNGHIFPYEDLKTSILDIPHRPLNYLHIPNKKVGAFAAAEFTYPTDTTTASGAPVVEALAAFWTYYDSEGLFAKVEEAYQEGRLAYSMEAVPEQVGCGNVACNAIFDYDGPASAKYCAHLQEHRSKKILHKPHFLAGALIVPPAKPGWAGAQIKEITQLLEADLGLTDAAYREIAAEQPDLKESQIETIIAWLLSA